MALDFGDGCGGIVAIAYIIAMGGVFWRHGIADRFKIQAGRISNFRGFARGAGIRRGAQHHQQRRFG